MEANAVNASLAYAKAFPEEIRAAAMVALA